MQDYSAMLGMHKKAHDPEMEPFIFSQSTKIKLVTILFLLPVIITALGLLSILFLNQELVLIITLIFGIIMLIIAIYFTQYTYRRLRVFKIAGSIVQDLIRLIELFGWRIQSALFPLMFLLFLFSFTIRGSEEGTTSIMDTLFQMIGLFLIFIGPLLILNSLLRYFDEYNQRLLSLDERTPSESFRAELKDWGKKIGFKDTKIRLADIPPNYYGKLAICVEKNDTVYIAYSKIAQYQAEENQSLVYCVRELCWLSLIDRRLFYILYSFHNTIYTLYLGLFGLLLYSSTSDMKLIHETSSLICMLIVVVLIIADAFMKVYLNSYDLILELKADQKTIGTLTSKEKSVEDIKRDLRLTEKIDPLSTGYPGFKFRRNALLPDTQKKTYWDKL